jgi:hypothetical protein
MPATPFSAGEKVTLSAPTPVAGASGGSFSYTVARPAQVTPQEEAALLADTGSSLPGPRVGAAATPATPSAISTAINHTDSTTLTAPTSSPPPFVTQPNFHPSAETDLPSNGTAATAPGLLLTTGGTQAADEITDNSGDLVWYNPVPAGTTDLQVINYMGQTALTFHVNNGQSTDPGISGGAWPVLDTHYHQIAVITADDGYSPDQHALEISPDHMHALMEIYNPVIYDDTANGGPPDLPVFEGVIQEIDLATGVMDFEWHSLATGSDGQPFVPLTDSLLPSNGPSPFDYIHLNSLQYVTNSTILFSGRHVSTVYKMDISGPNAGQIAWRLGGADTRNQFTFTDGDGGPSYAHDVQYLAGDGTGGVSKLSVFDNGVGRTPQYSRDVAFNLDEANLTASVNETWRHSPDLFGLIIGSDRLQPNGDQLISYGNTGYADEFDAAGNVVWARMLQNVAGNQAVTYRTIRAVWHATPQVPPAIVVNRTSANAVTVTGSWNGATDITGWQLFAGPNSSHLSAVSSVVPKTGFETSVNATVPAADSVFQMRAYQSINGVTTTGYSHTTGDAIATHYQALGGPSSFLGTPVGGETTIGSGLVQAYQGGNIYWSAATGAWSVRGNILAEYTNVMGGPTGALGFPTSDEQQVGPPDGRYNTFQVGNIYFSNATNAHEVQGLIMAHYAQLGGATGVLGFPTADEAASGPAGSGGRFSQFQVGNMYWTPPTGAHEVQGVILGHYLQLGGPSGVLGFPTSDETASPAGGRMNTFQVGDIFFSPGTGAFEVQGAILARYNSMGGPGSFLGFPTSDEFTPSPGFRQSNFQFGHYILFSWANGSTTVH